MHCMSNINPNQLIARKKNGCSKIYIKPAASSSNATGARHSTLSRTHHLSINYKPAVCHRAINYHRMRHIMPFGRNGRPSTLNVHRLAHRSNRIVWLSNYNSRIWPLNDGEASSGPAQANTNQVGSSWSDVKNMSVVFWSDNNRTIRQRNAPNYIRSYTPADIHLNENNTLTILWQ